MAERRVTLYIASSFDGYISGPNGELDWLPTGEGEGDEDYGYHEFYDSIDTVFMGRTTYKQVLSFDVPYPYTGKTSYVFTRSAEVEKDEHSTFVSEDISSFIERIQKSPGKDIWLNGGGQLVTAFMDAGLIDEIVLTIIPIVLGEGIPLLDKLDRRVGLKLIEAKSYDSGFVQLHYEVVR
jgi:dihydrofolate reductase